MDEIILLIFLFLVIFSPFQTLAQTTESSNDSHPPTDMRTATSGFTTTSNTILLGTSTTNGSHIVSVSETTRADGTTELSIETLVFPMAGLRVWHIAGLVISGVLIIIILVCCRVDIRIPRSKQEIDDDDRKRTENKKYIKELDSAVDGVHSYALTLGQ